MFRARKNRGKGATRLETFQNSHYNDFGEVCILADIPPGTDCTNIYIQFVSSPSGTAPNDYVWLSNWQFS